jgi:hypothetical protein
MYQQIAQPNLNWPYYGGLCEAFGEGIFGQASKPYIDGSTGLWTAIGKYPSAITAWNSNYGNGNHANEQPPSGMAVKVYFSLGDNRDGHTAIALANGTVISSTQAGWHATGYIHPNLANLISVYAAAHGSCTYLGWSEYSGYLHLVEQGDNDMVEDTDIYYNIFAQTFDDCTGRSERTGAKLSRTEFQNNFVGRIWSDCLLTIQGSPETLLWKQLAEKGMQASTPPTILAPGQYLVQ